MTGCVWECFSLGWVESEPYKVAIVVCTDFHEYTKVMIREWRCW